MKKSIIALALSMVASGAIAAGMDHSKMDASDPIMMAMMKKCMAQAQANQEELDRDHSSMKMEHENMKMDHSGMKMDHGSMKMDHSNMKDKVKESTKKAVDDPD